MPCTTCRSGCGCPMTGPGCGHYGCYGRGPVRCPGADAEHRRYVVLLAQRRRDHADNRARRTRLAMSYQAAALTYRLPGLS